MLDACTCCAYLHEGVPQKIFNFRPTWHTVEKPKSINLISRLSVGWTNKTFSSLISLCDTPKECKWSTAWSIWKNIPDASSSDKRFFDFTYEHKLDPSKHSIIKCMRLVVSTASYIRAMRGCDNCSIIFISLCTLFQCAGSFNLDLSYVFMATFAPNN